MRVNSQRRLSTSVDVWERIDKEFCRVTYIEESREGDEEMSTDVFSSGKSTQWWLVSDEGGECFPVEDVLQGLVGSHPIRVISKNEPPFGQWRQISDFKDVGSDLFFG